MFVLTVPVAEKVLRPVIVYIFLIAGLRLAGKRELAQLNPFDLIVLLTISNTVQNAIIGNDNSLIGGLIGAVTLLVINHGLVRFLYSHERIERIVEGRCVTLMENGKTLDDAMKRELVTPEELEEAARREGVGSLEDVDRAILESGGHISIIERRIDPAADRHSEILARLNAIDARLARLG
jgi:uncharacterized membrane protein YcaP (DUF421 family)